MYVLPPDFEEEREGRFLLVWGALGQWMVVDDELRRFIRLFHGGKLLRSTLKKHARRQNKSLGTVKREAMPVVEDFLRRGILSRSGQAPTPVDEKVSIANVTLNITNRCNLRCVWCYNSSRQTPDAPAEVLVNGIRSGAPLLDQGASLVVLGGEPLLYPDRLFAVLDGTADLFGQNPVVSTNGTQVTPELAAALAKRNVEVQVSLDSHDGPTHDSVRGPGVFERAIRGIGYLLEAGVYTILCRVYTSRDLQAFEPYLELGRQLQVKEVRFIPLRLIGGGTKQANLAPNQLESFRALFGVLRRKPELASLLVRDWFSIAATTCRRASPRISCGIGRRVLLVDADGLVYPCPNHVQPQHRAGDLAKETLVDIVENSSVFQGCRKEYCVSNYVRCSTCAFRGWCAGDCRGEVLALTADPLAPSPHCEEIQALYAELFWLLTRNECPLGQGPMPRTWL